MDTAPLKFYFIPGLGADERVFRHIRLPQGCEAVYLSWIQPLPDESLEEYALRMASPISREEKFVLVGLSFGGMLAMEIARKMTPVSLILISSIPVAAHMPPYFRLARFFRLYRRVPISLLQTFAQLKRLFTNETTEDKQMLRQMIRNCDPAFIRWAFGAALAWKGTGTPAAYIHIHGGSDAILPKRFTRPTHIVKGGHMVVLTRARQINSIIHAHINELKNETGLPVSASVRSGNTDQHL